MAKEYTPEAAHSMVSKAVERGELIRPDRCERCGSPPGDDRGIHGHHEDYSKPLDVVWLCRKCHCMRHAELSRAGIRVSSTEPSRNRVGLSWTDEELAMVRAGLRRLGYRHLPEATAMKCIIMSVVAE